MFKKRSVSVFIFISLLLITISYILGEINFFDVFFNIDDLEDTEKECIRDCRKMNSEACRELFEEGKNECDTIRDSEMSQCKSLAKKEKEQCKKNANNAHRACIGAVEEEKEECRKGLQTQKENCRIACKINTCTIVLRDSDNDTIIDIFDNCPHTSNQNQADSNNNGIGDACEEIPLSILCCVNDLTGQCFDTTIDNCREIGGAVMDCLPQESTGDDVIVSTLKNYTRVPFNASDSALVNLSRDVISTGVNNSIYNLSVYDCRNFAHDLERNLTTLGYNATWTAYWCYGGVGNPPATAHAVTDIHLADGRTIFVEPQNNQIINLDFDGDGQVEVNNNGYVAGQNMGQTDDNCKISVFEDRAAASAAGVPGA